MTSTSEPPQDAAFEADQAEIAAVLDGVAPASAGMSDELVSGEAADIGSEAAIRGLRYSDPDLYQPQLDDSAETGLDVIAGHALEVATIRSQLLGDEYPFGIDKGCLQHKYDKGVLYRFCLAVSRAARHRSVIHQRLVRYFDRIVCDLLKAYLGGDAVGVRFAWPRDKDFKDYSKIPEPVPARVEWMKKRCGFDGDGEFTFDNVALLNDLRAHAKDARIDVVVRKSHDDKRIGGLALLVQCGCGENDVNGSSSKFAELSTGWLRTFFARTSVPPPLRAFATSQHIVRSTQLYVWQSESGGLMFDRIRLCLLARRHPEVVASHAERMERYVKSFLGKP